MATAPSRFVPARVRRASQDVADLPDASPVAGLASVVAVLAGYVVFRTAIERLLGLERAAFREPILILEALKEPRTLVLFVLPFAAMFIRRDRTTWTGIVDGHVLRVVVGVNVALLAWAFGTYDFNVFLGQAHLLDRAALVALAAITFWTPKVVPLFLPYVMLVVDQFNIPLRFGQADKTLVFKVLMLFIVFLAVQLVRRMPGRVFVFATGILIAGNLFLSGFNKLRIGWLSNDLSNLWMAAHVNGFPGWMSTKAALRVGDAIGSLNPVLLVGTIVVECSFLALWWFRRSAPVILAAGAVFHLAIFLSSGIFFWKWIVLELLIAGAVLVIGWHRILGAIGGRWPAVAGSTVLIAIAPLYAAPVSLSWFDSPTTYTFELVATTPSGEVPVARHFFSPYDLVFSQNRFAFLSEAPTPVGTFATVRTKEQMEELAAVRTCDDLDALEATMRDTYKPGQKRNFERMVTTYMQDSLQPSDRGLGWRLLEWVQAPPHIWVQTMPPRLEPDDPVESVEIRRERRIYRDGRLIRCEPEPLSVLDLKVPADPPARRP